MLDINHSSLDSLNEYVYEDPNKEWGLVLEEEYKYAIHEAQKLEKTMLYLLDKEALRDKFVKVMWINAHRNYV